MDMLPIKVQAREYVRATDEQEIDQHYQLVSALLSLANLPSDPKDVIGKTFRLFYKLSNTRYSLDGIILGLSSYDNQLELTLSVTEEYLLGDPRSRASQYKPRITVSCAS